MIISPRKIYSKISGDNKIQFWTITVSCFVTVVTFYIGFAYQFLVFDNSVFEQRQLTHINLIKEFGPIFHTYDRAEKSLQSLYNILSIEDEDLDKNRYFVEYSDSLFSDIINFNNEIKNQQALYLLSKYMSPDSISHAAENIDQSIRRYEFLKTIKGNNIDRKNFKQRISIIAGETTTDLDSLYNTLNEIEEFSNNLLSLGINPQDRLDLEIKHITTLSILQELNILVKPIKLAKQDLLIFSWKRESPWPKVIVFFLIITIIMGILWIIILNITFKAKNPTTPTPSEFIDFSNQRHHIVSDFNSSEDNDEYVDDLSKIYDYQKGLLNDLRNEVNQLIFKLKNIEDNRDTKE